MPKMKGTVSVQPDGRHTGSVTTRHVRCHDGGHTEGWLEHEQWHPTGQTGG